MLKYIDLQRTFRDLTNEELEDSELLDFLDDQGISQSFGWQELLEHRRAILLAEAGAGKTREMREQTDRLVHDDQFAFFIPLESLDRESIPDFFSPEENEKLEAWKASRQEPAWFLLDSVDELKLNAGTLERALRRLSNEIHGNLDRARIIVSCRPSDWCPTVDLTTFRARLPLPEQLSDVTIRPPEEVFITPLKRERRTSISVTPKVEKLAHTNGVRTAAMLPMSKNKRSEWRQAYNAQAVVDAEGSQLVLGSRVSTCASDRRELVADVDTIPKALGEAGRVLADNGYASGSEVARLEARGLEVLVAVGAEDRRRAHDFRPPAEGKAPKEPKAEWLKRMKEKMETEENRALYRLRKQTVEPVFGIVKEAMGFRRFLLRGLNKVEGEWALVTLAYNCKRLHRLKMA